MLASIIGAIGGIASALIGSKKGKNSNSSTLSQIQAQINDNLALDIKQARQISILSYSVAGIGLLLAISFLRGKK